MALNSFITTEGLEMGRAQVMQAEAAGVEPSVRMNPILLKPTNDTGSQVIVNGVPIGNMDAAVYYQYKRKLVKPIMEAYDSLAAENDILVLEGAGSPAEINLKQEDIVNMGMAKLAHAPVLLAGDIDRGGVFASLYGTMALLEESERAMVKGMVINKFRGDVELLKPACACWRSGHVPFVGWCPIFPELDDETACRTAVRTAQRGCWTWW
ncbi:MAG: cobyric acid synthase [Anaeromassilibacillus sp.]